MKHLKNHINFMYNKQLPAMAWSSIRNFKKKIFGLKAYTQQITHYQKTFNN